MIEALRTLVRTCKVWNEQQKTQVLAWLECAKDFGENLDRCSEQLTKAKELIKNIIRVTWGEGWNYDLGWRIEAEQFLKEE